MMTMNQITSLVLERPLVSLDIESTGPDPDQDRVIEVGLVRLDPDGTITPRRWLCNPGCPIPPDSTKIHGITDADVAGLPPFVDLAAEIAGHLQGCDLAGFNIRRFDIPILKREFGMAGVDWPCPDARVVDAYVIFRDREPRNLLAAVSLYAGREHKDAHSAIADASAVLDVLMGQLARYPDLPRDLPGLDQVSGARQRDWASEDGKIRWDQNGDAIIAFGSQNYGLRLIDADNSLLHWILVRSFAPDVHEICRAVQRGERPRAPWSEPVPAQEPHPVVEEDGQEDSGPADEEDYDIVF